MHAPTHVVLVSWARIRKRARRYQLHRRRMRTRSLLVLTLVAAAFAATASARPQNTTEAAAPFAQSWANVPQTQAARRAKDVDGFHTLLTCCGAYWAAVTGNTPILRGAYNLDNKLNHVLDLVSAATATRSSLTFTIRPDANWYWGGKKLPVTYKDFVYTWQQ